MLAPHRLAHAAAPLRPLGAVRLAAHRGARRARPRRHAVRHRRLGDDRRGSAARVPPGGRRTRRSSPRSPSASTSPTCSSAPPTSTSSTTASTSCPLTYSGLVDTPVVTTIHGFSSPRIVPVYERYDATTTYVAISDADRHPRLHYAATIHHGIDVDAFAVDPAPGDHLLFFGRIHPDKGTAEAIEVAAAAGRRLVIAGIVQDERYFRRRGRAPRRRRPGPLRRPGRRGGALGGARWRPRPAPPDRLRRAVRLQRRRGDGLRDAGDRPRPRVDGRADRRRAHRVPRRATIDEAVRAVAAAGSLDRAAIRDGHGRRGSTGRRWSPSTSPCTATCWPARASADPADAGVTRRRARRARPGRPGAPRRPAVGPRRSARRART